MNLFKVEIDCLSGWKKNERNWSGKLRIRKNGESSRVLQPHFKMTVIRTHMGGVLSPGPNESGGVVFGALATYGLGCGLRDNNDKNKK